MISFLQTERRRIGESVKDLSFIAGLKRPHALGPIQVLPCKFSLSITSADRYSSISVGGAAMPSFFIL
jgi:hypothetical protein